MAKILVIEDEERLRRTIRVVLEMESHEVTEAPDGAVGLRLYREHGADLVLVDMFMEGRDGLEFIRALRTEAPHPIIVAMSGGGRTGQVDILRAAEALGASRTLVKPFELQDLITTIREALSGH